MMLQPTEAPGRAAPAAPNTPVATATPAPSAGAPQGAPPSAGGFGGMGMMLLLPLLLFGVIFLMNRGDKKRRKKIESGLKKGDRVLTRSGIKGKLIEVGDLTVRVEIAPGVNVTMIKSAVDGLDEPQASAGAANKTARSGQGKLAKTGAGKKN